MINKESKYFWLSLAPFSSANKYKLISKFSIDEVFERIGSDKELGEALGEDNCQRAKKQKSEDFIDVEYEKLYKANANFISIENEKYPERLKQSEVVPPVGLYYKGDAELLNTMSVSIVGTRHSTEYGKQVAFSLVEGLRGYGITVVSGMATGIDAYAHAACLKNDINTVAVLGSGVNMPTPLGNINLYRSICEKGLVVSEYPINFEAAKYTFPERNRIISGLSDACIVVEAAAKSGSLITADRANEQGREVFAVPGSIFSPKSEGTINLIKNGASLLTGVKDILSFFNLQNTKNSKISTLASLDFFEQSVYNLLQNREMSIDELKNETGFEVKDILGILFSLEFKDVIIALPNNIYKLRGSIS